jgi:hypothetical protein
MVGIFNQPNSSRAYNGGDCGKWNHLFDLQSIGKESSGVGRWQLNSSTNNASGISRGGWLPSIKSFANLCNNFLDNSTK